MAVIPGYDHDLFVSYAHIDNLPLHEGAPGWVDMLVESLKTQVYQRLGTKAFDCWKDRRLEGNIPITPEIVSAVRSSALLLVVLSPAYLQSEWCRRERNEFLAAGKDRAKSGSGPLFIVRARPLDQGEIPPPEFGDLRGYEFWALDPGTRAERLLGLPDPLETKFINKILDLSYDMKKQVAGLKAAAMGAAPETKLGALAPTGARCVFVAQSTDDLADREDELRAYLSQAGIAVLPTMSYPQTDAAAFEAAMLADLGRCDVFAQLLGPSHGRKLPFAPEARLPRLQYELAHRAGIPIVQWRERGLNLTTVEDPAHRMLLDQARACGIEEFKRAVVDGARKEPTLPQHTHPANVMVFVNADSETDQKLAEEVGNTLERQFGIDCFWRLQKGSAEVIRRDFERNLLNCDGLLLVYGATGVDWVRAQILEGKRILSKREQPPPALAIFDGPPPENKDDLSGAISSWERLNCRNSTDVGVLKRFVDRLHCRGSHAP